MKSITIITRNSKLAMWQALHVKQLLQNIYPELEVLISGITTEGDRILDQSLEKIGGKGLFIKELEYQLLAGNADIAVHSLKDLPANLPSEFELAAILKREDAHDAFVSNKYKSLDEMPVASIVGSSSARRVAILKQHYPHLEIKLLRGNLQTRLAKLDNNEYDAIILAVAGLKRLDLEARITQILADDKFIPAIGQGALAVEIKSGEQELKRLLAPLNDEISAALVGAEREMGRYLNASCNIPLAGFARIVDNQLKLSALLADVNANVYLTAEVSGTPEDYLSIGKSCAEQLIKQGAAEIVRRLSAANHR